MGVIEKGRLEELIEQEATIWSEQFREKFLLKDFTNIDFYNGFVSCFYNNRELIINLNKVFETQEEAEWHREFGCIERTERLELPTWEEIQKYERFDFKDKYNHSYTLHYISGFKTLAISGWSTEYYAEATKENYTLACRKAKELFLGLGEKK